MLLCKKRSNFPFNPKARETGRQTKGDWEANNGRIGRLQGSASLPRQRKLGSHTGLALEMTITGNHEGDLTKSFATLRVLDFSTTIAGPHCARMLADMGADVIKIETAEGETMRTRPPLRNGCSTA